MTATVVNDLVELFETEAAADRPEAASPDVGIVMGRDSDLDVMSGAYDPITELGFAEVTDYDDPPSSRYTFETYAFSAHRTPELLAIAPDDVHTRLVEYHGGLSAGVAEVPWALHREGTPGYRERRS